jgi:cytidylate kinase
MIRIVTIEREYGSGAREIAYELARRLGWKLWDERLTEEIARLSHCGRSDVRRREERRDPLYYRLLKSFALGSWEGSPNTSSVEILDADSIVQLSERAVRRAAAEGNCVIVGRGSQHFLRDNSDTLRFFLYASGREKIWRLVSEGKTESEAKSLVETVDRERAAFIKKYFHVKWPNRWLYHAMLNTAAGNEMVIRAILSFHNNTTSGECVSPVRNQ